jgi:hypothetical protein
MRGVKFIVFLLFLISAGVFTQGSYLNISLYDDSEFYIIFDNTSYSEPGNFAEFDNISPGEHQVKIIQYDASMSAQGNAIYDGKIKIPAGYDNYAVIDEYNSLVIYKKIRFGTNRCDCSTRKRIGDKTGEIKYDDQKDLAGDCKYKAIKKKDFDDLTGSINSRNFESTNINTVKEAIDKNYFTSEQVRELLKYFTFEDSKLDIAKHSYKKVCDKNNFFKN